MGVIEFNGIASKDLGVEVETFPDYVAPEKEYQVTHVPGRNGDLVVDTKTFQNVPRSYEVSVATNGVPIEVVNAAVARFKSDSRMPIKSLTSEIVAVQDLHGYDHPWPAGGGKNLCPRGVVENVSWAYDFASHATDIVAALNNLPAGTYTISYTSTVTSVSDSFTSETALAYSGGMSILYNGKDIAVSMPQITRSQALAHYSVQKSLKITITPEDVGKVTHVYTYGLGRNTATEGAPSGVCGTATFSNIQIEVGSTATEWTPYENICPITGFDSGVITRCGKNLFDNSLMVNARTTVIDDTVTLTATGNFQGSAFAYMPVKQGYKYALSWESMTNGSAVEVRHYDFNGNLTDNTLVLTSSTVITIHDGVYKISIVYGNRIAGAGTFVLKGFNIALGENYQSYTPYNGNIYTIPFGQTIYNGYFNTNGGEIVTHGMVNLGSLDWIYHAASGNVSAYFDTYLPSDSITGNKDVAFNGMCEIYNIIPSKNIALSGYDYDVCSLANNTRRFITCDTRYTDAASYKNAMNGVMLFYPLATPRATRAGEGNLVITHGRVDLGNLTWSDTDGSGLHNSSNISDIIDGWYAQDLSDYLCETFIPKTQFVGWASMVNGEYGTNNKYIRVKWTDISSGADFKTFVTGKNLVYKLATPIVLPIQSQNIFTLPGENTIFSNSGDVSVKVEPSFSAIINQVAEWLHSASGYARLEDTYDSDYYRMAYYSESLSVENLFNEAGKATLNFICKPQRYFKSGETPVVFTEEGIIQNGTRFSSSPVLKVTTDNTQGSVSIGNHSITIKAGAGTDPITIDCELQDAWSGTTNKNSFIVLTDGEFPVIDPGAQTVTFDGGVQSVEVIPRWWAV